MAPLDGLKSFFDGKFNIERWMDIIRRRIISIMMIGMVSIKKHNKRSVLTRTDVSYLCKHSAAAPIIRLSLYLQEFYHSFIRILGYVLVWRVVFRIIIELIFPVKEIVSESIEANMSPRSAVGFAVLAAAVVRAYWLVEQVVSPHPISVTMGIWQHPSRLPWRKKDYNCTNKKILAFLVF